MSARFSTLPPEVHQMIMLYVWDAYRNCFPWDHSTPRKIHQYALLNHTWRQMIQSKLYHTLAIRRRGSGEGAIEQLRVLVHRNPQLAGYIHTLDFSTWIIDDLRYVCLSKLDMPRPRQENLSTADVLRSVLFPKLDMHRLKLDIPGLRQENLSAADVAEHWLEVLELLRDIQKARMDVGAAPSVAVLNYTVFIGSNVWLYPPDIEASIQDFSEEKRMEIERYLDSENSNKLGCLVERVVINAPSKSNEYVYVVLLGQDNVGTMLKSLGNGVQKVELLTGEYGIGQRRLRRRLYTGLVKTISTMRTPELLPNLTVFHLDLQSFQPWNYLESRIYSNTTLDNGVDLLSASLRVLSKQLVEFKYENARISSALFQSETDSPSAATESTMWPHLETYIVRFAPIHSSGTRLFHIPRHRTLGLGIPPAPSELPMVATDPDWVDPIYYDPTNVPEIVDGVDRDIDERLDSQSDLHNFIKPIPSLINPLFRAASQAMAGNMPKIKYWVLQTSAHNIEEWDREYICLRFAKAGVQEPEMKREVNGDGEYLYDDSTYWDMVLNMNKKDSRMRLEWSKLYKHEKETLALWMERYGWPEGLRLLKVGYSEILTAHKEFVDECDWEKLCMEDD